MESKEVPLYGEKPFHNTVDGAELLGEGSDVAEQRLLTNDDLKRIKIKRMRAAVRKVDRKGFASSSEDSDGSVDEEAALAPEEQADSFE